MHLIHCLNNISARGTDLLTDSYELTDDFSQATGVLVRSAAMHDLEFPEGLLAIARAGAGVNNIPLDRCAEEGIVVFNTPGANANSVKELVLCGLFLGSRGIVDGINWCREHADDADIAKNAEKVKKQFAGTEILGKKLGVIGLGAIGSLVANTAVDLGMEVYGYDPYVSVGAAWLISNAVKPVINVDDIYRECDYITIHTPAMEATKDMIDERALSQMKEGVVFLNFSRDSLVDDGAMTAALASGKVRAYITDFATPTIMRMEHTIVLPHLGASTEEAEENCAMMAARQMMDYIENGNITNSVNFPACDMGVCPEGESRIAVMNRNIPGMVSQMSNVLGEAGVNIENLTNKSKGEYAYTLIDIGCAASEELVERIKDIDGVLRVRVVC